MRSGDRTIDPLGYIVGGPSPNFLTISAALNAAPAGEVVEVHGGPHAERVIISKPGVKLRGVSAVLDGATVDGGRGIGIHVTGVADVEVSGFTVRNFERGIVVQHTRTTVIRQNEVHSNNSKTANTAPPLAPGVDLFEGVVLLGASGTQVTDNAAEQRPRRSDDRGRQSRQRYPEQPDPQQRRADGSRTVWLRDQPVLGCREHEQLDQR